MLCLNPYCSGRWSRTLMTLYHSQLLLQVLILIVVEDGLVQLYLAAKEAASKVLILIVVEDGLVPTITVDIETLTQ